MRVIAISILLLIVLVGIALWVIDCVKYYATRPRRRRRKKKKGKKNRKKRDDYESESESEESSEYDSSE